MTSLVQLSDTDLCQLPLDRLALVVLEHLESSRASNSHNFLNDAIQRGVSEPAQLALSEALNWLIARGLVARDKPGQTTAQSIFVTRAGKTAPAEGLEAIDAAARLDVDLHPRLARVRTQFLVGEYELAAFAAMREVEIRVRERSGLDDSTIGVRLMRQAFKPDGGPLFDDNLDSGERVGIMELFAGAIGTFKNPPSHRQIDYDDPTEASEVVLLADLLLRILDRQ